MSCWDHQPDCDAQHTVSNLYIHLLIRIGVIPVEHDSRYPYLHKSVVNSLHRLTQKQRDVQLSLN